MWHSVHTTNDNFNIPFELLIRVFKKQSFFLTGDVAWVEENYSHPARKGWLALMLVEADRDAQRDSLDRTHTLYQTRKDLIVVSGHDGRMLEDQRLRQYVVE
jgi:hypothetical protein